MTNEAIDRKHECRKPTGCICSVVALEPDEDCPQHGNPYPHRCEICGRFIERTKGACIMTNEAIHRVLEELREMRNLNVQCAEGYDPHTAGAYTHAAFAAAYAECIALIERAREQEGGRGEAQHQ